MASGIVDLIQKIMTLTSSVGELKAQVDRIDDCLRDLTERIVKLETREELIIEKIRNAVLSHGVEINNQLIERVVHLEQSSHHLPSAQTPALPQGNDPET